MQRTEKVALNINKKAVRLTTMISDQSSIHVHYNNHRPILVQPFQASHPVPLSHNYFVMFIAFINQQFQCPRQGPYLQRNVVWILKIQVCRSVSCQRGLTSATLGQTNGGCLLTESEVIRRVRVNQLSRYNISL